MSRLKINRDGTFTDDAQTHTFVADQTFNYDGSLVTNIEVSGTGEWIVVAQLWGVSAKFNKNAVNEALEASQTPQDVKIAALEAEMDRIKTRADPVVTGHTYTEPQVLILKIPAQGTPNAADPYLDINNDAVDYGKDAITLVPAGWKQDGPDLTNAEFALTNMAEAAAADIVGAFTALTDPQIQDRTDTTVGLIAGGKQLFDERQVNKGVAANFNSGDADHEVAKPWDAKTLVDKFGMPIEQLPDGGTTVVGKQNQIHVGDITPPTITPPTSANDEYAIGIKQATRAAYALMTPAQRAAVTVKVSHWSADDDGVGGFVWNQTEGNSSEALAAGDPNELYRKNTYFLDDANKDIHPTPVEGGWFEKVVYQIDRASFDGTVDTPFVIERLFAIEDPANAGNFYWSDEGVRVESGDTAYSTYFTERLQVFWFDFHDRRASFESARRQRYSLTADELETGNAEFVLNTDATYAQQALKPGYTRLVGRMLTGAGPDGYDIIIDWKRNNGEYEIIISDSHNSAPNGGSGWGINTYGGIDNVVVKYSPTNPPKPVWEENTPYFEDDILIAQAPAGVAETQDDWFVGTATTDRVATPTLDAAEWVNWTWVALTPVKQDVVVATLADRPAPATLLSGSRVSVVDDPNQDNNGSYTAIGPVDGAAVGYSEEHTHKALKNIAVHVRSAGTNASSSVDIELLIDGAWNPTDWVVSTTPVTGLESYTAHGPVHYDKAAITGPIGISHNKDGWLFFEYVGDAAEGELTGVNYTGADGANSDGEIIVNLAGTNQAVTFANKAAVVATDLEFQQAAEATAAKNALVYPVGNFTALPVNDSGTGEDGAVYKLPTVDALQITLPNKADMNAAEGIYRVRVSGDWAALSTQATVLSFIDDTANGVDMGTGLPDDGNEWLDLVFDVASDKWIATSGGDVTLTQVIPTYDEHAEVPANIRLYLASGIGAAAEGLWRKETAGDAPNMIG